MIQRPDMDLSEDHTANSRVMEDLTTHKPNTLEHSWVPVCWMPIHGHEWAYMDQEDRDTTAMIYWTQWSWQR